MLRKIRIALAAVFFILITALFLDFTGTIQQYAGWMAKLQLLPAIMALNVLVLAVLAILTLALGRVYCSVICPLGVFQDIVARISRIFRKKDPYKYSKPKNWLRIALFVIMAVGIVFGVSVIVTFLSPYSSYGMMVTNLFQPGYIWANNCIADFAEAHNNYDFYAVEWWMRSLPSVIVSAGILLAVIIMACVGGRTYCNTVCPVGTLLGFLSKFSWLKPVIDKDKCRKCRKCERNCKAAAIRISKDDISIDYTRCVACMDCIGNCKFDAMHYCHPKAQKSGSPDEKKTEDSKIDTGRRMMLTATAVAAASSAVRSQVIKLDGGIAAIEDKKAPARMTRLTPPGSISVRNLTSHCTSCQLCIAECPNQVLRPSSDLSRFLQPEMSYERGYCRPECTRCSEVCPSGAIRLITKEEKSSIQIGHAEWIRKNCIPLTDGQECGNCARHCPAGAIEMVPSDPSDENSVKIPVVNVEMCIGCGTCENLCPARPFSAIYVEGHEVHKTI